MRILLIDNKSKPETKTSNIHGTLLNIHAIDIVLDDMRLDTYCYFINGELWVKNMHIAQYSYGSYNNHVERRERKLLLNKKELRNLAQDAKTPGFTIVPIKLYLSENGYAKLDIALAKGKKSFDKRQTMKEKEDRREMDRAMKVYK